MSEQLTDEFFAKLAWDSLMEELTQGIEELTSNEPVERKKPFQSKDDVYLLGATEEGIVYLTGYADKNEIEDGMAISRVLKNNYYRGSDFTKLKWYYTERKSDAKEYKERLKECNRELFLTIDECQMFMELHEIPLEPTEVDLVPNDERRNQIDPMVKQMKAFRRANLLLEGTPFDKAVWKPMWCKTNKYVKEVIDGVPVCAMRIYGGGEEFCLEVE